MPTDPPPAVENERVDLEAIRAREQDKDITKFLGHARIDILSLLREVARLQGIVSKLPVTADGVPVTVNDKVWTAAPYPWLVNHVERDDPKVGPIGLWLAFSGYDEEVPVSECYSTRESALAALRAHPGAEGKESEPK